MTSNVGAKQVNDFANPLGFTTKDSDSRKEEARAQILKKELKNTFRPEFLNRIEHSVIFKPLEKKSIEKIVKLELKNLQERLKEKKYIIKFDRSVVNFIVEEGYDDKFGARPIKRAIQNKLEDFISEEILKGTVIEEGVYNMKVEKDDKITIVSLEN